MMTIPRGIQWRTNLGRLIGLVCLYSHIAGAHNGLTKIVDAMKKVVMPVVRQEVTGQRLRIVHHDLAL